MQGPLVPFQKLWGVMVAAELFIKHAGQSDAWILPSYCIVSDMASLSLSCPIYSVVTVRIECLHHQGPLTLFHMKSPVADMEVMWLGQRVGGGQGWGGLWEVLGLCVALG